jgi:hypothetical protein
MTTVSTRTMRAVMAKRHHGLKTCLGYKLQGLQTADGYACV